MFAQGRAFLTFILQSWAHSTTDFLSQQLQSSTAFILNPRCKTLSCIHNEKQQNIERPTALNMNHCLDSMTQNNYSTIFFLSPSHGSDLCDSLCIYRYIVSVSVTYKCSVVPSCKALSGESCEPVSPLEGDILIALLLMAGGCVCYLRTQLAYLSCQMWRTTMYPSEYKHRCVLTVKSEVINCLVNKLSYYPATYLVTPYDMLSFTSSTEQRCHAVHVFQPKVAMRCPLKTPHTATLLDKRKYSNYSALF